MTASATNLLEFDRAGLEAWFDARGEKSFRGVQVLKWIHQQWADDFSAMSNLGKALRETLAAGACIREPQVVSHHESADGTRKWVVRVADGNCVETVFIPDGPRGTLCISSQAGCPLDCRFCSTGRQGFSRNLAVAEIIGQVRIAARALGHSGHGTRVITNIVLMGMGEPLLNFDNVVTAMAIMMDDNAYGIARRKVTLSTAGIVPGIDRLRDASPCSLAVSLHAPENALRDELVPINRSYPLGELMAACRRFAERDGRAPITFEYVMLEGVNDSPALARQLVRLLAHVPAKVNLIPFNAFPGAPFRRPAPETVNRFRDILIEAGIMTITRKTRGDDIDAACGQLVGQVLARSARHRRLQELPA
ncbi:MAG: 23S rRNA (adenine(2503)-C(2))-methyltransferase RlmN [Gammaproteobacteria bacterium]|nr:23S rRNA (adenine(2503)-C(2))-methyltransferase RlmN [Gammaproteobacteria bacterium]